MAASQNAVNGPVPLPKNKPDAVAVVGLAVKDAPRPSDRPAGLELPPHPLSTGLLSRNDLGSVIRPSTRLAVSNNAAPPC